MNQLILCLAVLVTTGGFILGQSLEVTQAGLNASETVLSVQFPSGEKVIEAAAEDQAQPIPIQFTVPRNMPVFLSFESMAARPGRIVIHVAPEAIPADLEAKAPDQDWANPAKRFDFRAVVSLKSGPWQQHVLSLNEDFFEAITKPKLPYNLRSVVIKNLSIETSQPQPPNQKVQVRDIRLLVLSGAAMKKDLAERTARLQKSLSTLSQNSAAHAFWKPRVDNLATEAKTFEADNPEAQEWQQLARKLHQLELVSQNWRLASKCELPYCVGIESSLKRVSGQHEQLVFSGSVGGRVELQAARNEYESFQLVLIPISSGLDQVTFKIGDLRAEDGKHLIASENITLFDQIEQTIKPSPGTSNRWAGRLPDCLRPLDGPIAVEPTQTKPIWVNVFSPPETPPGMYRGRIKILPKNLPGSEVEVSVRVHSFQIPATGQFRTQGHFSLEDLKAWYGSKYSDQVRRDFYRLLQEHRLTPTSQYSARLSPEPEDIPWILKQGGNVLLIGGFSGAELDHDIIGPAYNWLVKNGQIRKALIYIGDETDDFEKMRQKALTIRRNWPQLRIMIGGSKPREELIGYMDVWDPITHGGNVYDFDPLSTRQAIDRGEEVFWYTCVGPRMPFANVYNDHPLTAIRALWWQAWKYGVTGFEYWWFNYWKTNDQLRGLNPPWPISRAGDWNSRSFDWANGDGLLVYPGPDGQALPSIRLSVIRDAIEDWEILFILRRTTELARQQQDPQLAQYLDKAEKLLQVPGELTRDLMSWSDNPAVYWRVRNELYQVLDVMVRTLGDDKVKDHIADWVEKHDTWLQDQFEARVKASLAR